MTDNFPARLLDTSVSHGTRRAQDLIPAFIDALREVAPAAYTQIIAAPFPLVPAYVTDGGDSHEWWNSEDAAYATAVLEDELCSQAPDGYYFGAHPGDGSDFGFWKYEE